MRTRWYTYVLKCADGNLYVGITNNLRKRVASHNAGTGAKWTRGRRPVLLVYRERQPDRSGATKREIEIKKWTRAKKLALIRSAKTRR